LCVPPFPYTPKQLRSEFEFRDLLVIDHALTERAYEREHEF